MDIRPQINTIFGSENKDSNLSKSSYFRIGNLVLDSSQILAIDETNFSVSSDGFNFQIYLKGGARVIIDFNINLNREGLEIEKIISEFVKVGSRIGNHELEALDSHDIFNYQFIFGKDRRLRGFSIDEDMDSDILNLFNSLISILDPFKERFLGYVHELQNDLINNTLKCEYIWEGFLEARFYE